MKIWLSTLFLITIIPLRAQKLHLNFFAGISNYQGDMQAKRFTFQQANAAVGVGVLYEISSRLYARANITAAKIKGNDRISGTDPVRNLRFVTPITEVQLGLEYDLLNSYERSLIPFFFAGAAVFRFNPYTHDSTGTKVFLQPLGTEGQGFFLNRTQYKLNSVALPFGLGIKVPLSADIRVRFEFGIRKTFTDYLDDVSTTYAGESELLLNNGPLAADLAFRGDEDKSGLSYPPSNTIRGNPSSKDWYYFTGLGISFRLSPSDEPGSMGRGYRKTNTGCPTNIF